MPVLRPDVIKLDLRLVQEQPTPEIAAIMGAVGAQAERTGATVLAEGIETAEQAQYARALGATVGQGYHLGRPTADPQRRGVSDVPLPIYTTAMPHPWRTPFDLVSARRPVRQGTTPLLAAVSSELERQAASTPRSSLLISNFPEVSARRGRVEACHEELAGQLAFGVMVVPAPPLTLASGLRAMPVADDDPLRGTWNVLVISAHFASMLAGRARGGSERAHEPEFDFVVTYDRDLIVECAQGLMLRIAASEA